MTHQTERRSEIIVDDGARHADTVPHEERMPRFDRNGLDSCDKTVFTPEHKRRAWTLMLSA